ncbi:MAG TPA: SAM-dependent methyltransferase [Lachnospiraceae bacterium]|nr:SAM-dependent methyltransferase [Lachnospiraceae bacterium]
MKAEYKNWIPKRVVLGYVSGAAAFAAAGIASFVCGERLPGTVKKIIRIVSGVGFAGFGLVSAWSVAARRQFSYKGERKLMKSIVEGTAEYVNLPEGGTGLDVGCGSGALTIACAKRNPKARFLGIDSWEGAYRTYGKALCEKNALAEGVHNASFQKGDALNLGFPGETFDAVTSNYVYHNITGVDRQKLIKETLRVLKKGGTFAIHDIMTRARYGDMRRLVKELREEGFEEVRIIPTDSGEFMTKKEAVWLTLSGSCLLTGKK